jgi:hypothetical protein
LFAQQFNIFTDSHDVAPFLFLYHYHILKVEKNQHENENNPLLVVDTLPKVDYNRLVNQTKEVFKMGLSLKQIRLVREKTQDEMAEKLGVHVQTYRKLEENPDEVTIKQAKIISEFLGVSYDDIFFAQ